jgi:2-polyprenyl-6-methoxyphenol hydroxylase-like FAD-dependent oxidoreductase
VSAPRRALVSGASIAGPTIAFWLNRCGWDVTIVERAPAVRGGGYAIDIRGSAAEVAMRMGIYDEAVAARVRPQPSRMLTPGGRTMVRIALNDVIAAVNSVDVEILRGDLTRILYERTRDDVEYVFNTSISSIEQRPDGVDVELSDGTSGSYDVVIGADGIHSNTRRLVFGPEQSCIHHLGPCVCIFNVRGLLAPGEEGGILTTPGRTLGVGPLSAQAAALEGGSGARVFMSFLVDDPGAIDVHDEADVFRVLRSVYADSKWIAPRVLASLERAEELYFDTVSQIRMDRWSQGRVALIGDAAYAPSFLSGQGTSIAMLGAYVLATELCATGDVTAAMAAYEQRLRPFVEKNQALALRKNSNVLPRDARSLWRRNLRFVSVPWRKRLGLMKRLSGEVREASNDFSLVGYGLA